MTACGYAENAYYNGWTNILWHIYIYIYIMDYLSSIKRNEFDTDINMNESQNYYDEWKMSDQKIVYAVWSPFHEILNHRVYVGSEMIGKEYEGTFCSDCALLYL